MSHNYLSPARWALLAALLIALPLSSSALAAFTITKRPAGTPFERSTSGIDLVRVLKSERQLQLISNGQVVRSYRVSLGKSPKGHKEYEGDRRTPEGTYTLDWRQHSKNYQLSIHIDYPNAQDRLNAAKIGRDPGSMIMLHGTPIDEEFPEWYFNTLDWTDGCIALNNRDMREVWERVLDGTKIEILP